MQAGKGGILHVLEGFLESIGEILDVIRVRLLDECSDNIGAIGFR